MPDADPQPQPNDCSGADDYPNPMDSATPSFPTMQERLLAEIAESGPLAFPDFLDLALYHPEQGYYAAGSAQVGRDGDFYTSVSVGPLFGKLLAHRFLKWWEENGQPAKWRVLEIGAHDGKLAADILAHLASLSPGAWHALEYAVAEPLPRLRTAQEARLRKLSSRLFLAPSLGEIAAQPLPGIAFGNEILDALPFHLVKMTEAGWREIRVSSTPEKELVLAPSLIPSHSPLSEKLAALGDDFPLNYQTELRTNFPDFLQAVSACLENGMLLFIDYGFAAPEYYDRHRSNGTLRTFFKHRAAEDPLDRPGGMDITAHVDFTDLAISAQTVGLSPTEFSTQSSYLTHLAKDLIIAGELNDKKSIAQFQSLTHPAHLGAKFHAIELRQSPEIPENVRHRLAL
ncbi:class I SAM-dependent methyltransferase [Luteolibacter algae]|uniref:Class I SAM-dependent methyltransferase n=1 Tax=Luteolibacter algae TaxID=454151 RepID=A0ABW5D6G5_9BACT